MANLRESGSIQIEPTSFATSGDVVFSEWIGRGLGQASGVPIDLEDLRRCPRAGRQDRAVAGLP
jgi:hypothetical protein